MCDWLSGVCKDVCQAACARVGRCVLVYMYVYAYAYVYVDLYEYL